MKIFIFILIIIFNFQSLTKANDVKEFEIEGMSVGDSLLDYFSKTKIKEFINHDSSYSYANGDYVIIGLSKSNQNSVDLNTYQNLGITINKSDRQYEIKSIAGQSYTFANIKECNTKEWKKHTWNNYTTGEFTSEPTKELDVMSCTQEQQKKLTPALIEALDEYQKICSWEGEKTGAGWLTTFSPVRFNKYEVGTMMRKHYDHIHSIFDGKRKGVPIVSIVGNLNEDYEGSEFHCRGKEIKLKTGDILMFPSNFMYPHEVTECTKGTRYSFVSWAF